MGRLSGDRQIGRAMKPINRFKVIFSSAENEYVFDGLLEWSIVDFDSHGPVGQLFEMAMSEHGFHRRFV